MKCERCGATTRVVETRVWKDMFIRRVRICFNEHRFATFEVTEGLVNKSHLPKRLAAAPRRIRRSKSRHYILTNPEGLELVKLAEATGYTVGHVRAIRSGRR